MNVRVSTLPNGLRVVSHEMSYLETVSLGVWVRAGSRDECAKEDGIAHFLEHMAFKGTKSRSAFDLVESIEDVGGDLNAATGTDQTAYYATMLKGDVPLAVELLADIVIHPVFAKTEIARERDVIIQEIMSVGEQPEDLVFDMAQVMAFPDQALGRPVMGTVETVSSFKRSDLQKFMDVHYKASNMVLCAAGAIEHDRLCELALQHFDELPMGEGQEIVPASYKGGIDMSDLPLEQGHVLVAFEGVGFTRDEIFAAQVLNYTLGGGMSSRLFQEIREERGLAYQVYSHHSSFEESGLFGFYAATDPKRSVEVTELILSEIGKIIETGISLKELDRAKAQLKSGLAMCLESTGSRAEQIARQILYFDRLFSNQDLCQEIVKVTIEDCSKMALKMVASGDPTIAVAGAGQNIDEFSRFKSFFAA